MKNKFDLFPVTIKVLIIFLLNLMIKKQDIAKHIATRFSIPQRDALAMVIELFEFMKDSLKKWEEISIFEFFKMGTKDALSRNTIHPKDRDKSVKQKAYKKVYCAFTFRFKSIIKDLYR